LDKQLHIVCLDVPWPVDYGGVVDLFYKIRSLHQLGVKIHLHCFTKNRKPQEALNKYCETVNYYERKKNKHSFSFSSPLIVNSRVNDGLIANLQKDDHPVLLEGIHCTHYVGSGQLVNRKVVVRLHNTEFEYYKQLAKHEKGLFKKLYFLHESRLLKKYEKNIAHKVTIIAVSRQDKDLYQQVFSAPDIHYIPVFLPYTLAVGKDPDDLDHRLRRGWNYGLSWYWGRFLGIGSDLSFKDGPGQPLLANSYQAYEPRVGTRHHILVEVFQELNPDGTHHGYRQRTKWWPEGTEEPAAWADARDVNGSPLPEGEFAVGLLSFWSKVEFGPVHIEPLPPIAAPPPLDPPPRKIKKD
jgi:hypothetical protein